MPAVARTTLAPSRASHIGKHRVLYAEDQTTTRVVTTALLERLGYEVVAVEDGELAVEQAKASLFDVILLDIEMPVMDGVTAARSIRRDVPQAKGTPILALSAFLADSTEHSVWRDAFDSAVPKPANSNELGRALNAALKDRVRIDVDIPWTGFSLGLSSGMRHLLVRTAAQEMHHLALAIASCAAAADVQGELAGRVRLKNLAESFGATQVGLLVEAGAAESLFGAIDIWQSVQGA